MLGKKNDNIAQGIPVTQKEVKHIDAQVFKKCINRKEKSVTAMARSIQTKCIEQNKKTRVEANVDG